MENIRSVDELKAHLDEMKAEFDGMKKAERKSDDAAVRKAAAYSKVFSAVSPIRFPPPMTCVFRSY